jgi:hypothetical protein
MARLDRCFQLTVALLAACFCVLVIREVRGGEAVHAAEARFDHVTIVSSAFLYKGEAGLLLLDRRNGNVWYMGHKEAVFAEPILLGRVPFEKLDGGSGAQ